MTYGVGRTTASYASYAGYSTGTVNYAEAGSVAESIVFEQTFTTFDEASNVIEVASYQRDYNAPASGSGSLGPLNGPGGSDPTGRATFVAIYLDGVGRTANTADYGTNGNSSFSRPTACGTRSATLLITTNIYDQTGVIVQIVDPAATVTMQVFDQAGRRTQLILNYVYGGTGADQNQTTNWTYNPDSNVASMTAVNAATDDQVTTYGYGITVSGGSTLNSNSPLQSVTHPDSGVVTVEYNRQGDVILRTDQNGTVHSYGFDLLGRPSTDSVTTLGDGLDDSVLQIAVTYEIRGMVQNITSYNAATDGTVVNDVQRVYNEPWDGPENTRFRNETGYFEYYSCPFCANG
jgi:YD repeat-containing protein